MTRRKRGVKFSLTAFAVLVLAGLAMLFLFRRVPQPGPLGSGTPGVSAQALRQDIADEIRVLGVTPALTSPGSSEHTLSFRLPRSLGKEVLRQALDRLAQSKQCVLTETAAFSENVGLDRWTWSIGQGKKEILRLEIEKSAKPALAILIDDWGYNTRELWAVLALPPQVSLAVFPFEVKSRVIAEKAAAAGHEILLHLPMEPHASIPLVKGTLRGDYSDEQISQMLGDEIDALPQIAGINNHEGSKGTEDPRVVSLVLKALKKNNLYFLDSRTSPKSVVVALAEKEGVRQASRRVFLDNEDYVDSIQEAARHAAHLAQIKGSCIAIGHGRPNTLKVIAELVPEWKQMGIELVPVSELVK